MLRTIVVSISNFVCRIMEPFRTDYAGCGCVCCEDALYDLRQYEADVEAGLYDFGPGENGDPLNDCAGSFPEQLDNGQCGCGRQCLTVLACGHCTCEGECDDCPENRIWLRLADGELSSWCGCAEPGKVVLACGHCGCGNSDLCWECVVVGSDQLVEKRRKASCA